MKAEQKKAVKSVAVVVIGALVAMAVNAFFDITGQVQKVKGA